MIRKRNSNLTLIASIALAIILCISVSLPVFAAVVPIPGTADKPAEAVIAKVLKMPVGTITPDITFTFKIDIKSVDESTDDADIAAAPTIDPLTVTYKAEDEGTVIGTGTGAYKSVPKETESIFTGANWKNAGVYVYTVTEVKGTLDTFKEKMTYSEAEYELWALVKEKADKQGFYVEIIAAYIKTEDAANEGEKGKKVDPTPQDPDSTGKYSEMIFTNAYLKNNGGTDPKTNSVFKLSKRVDGDILDTNKYFKYTVTVTQPATVTGTSAYKAYVMDENNNVVTDISNNAADEYIETETDGNLPHIEFPSGTEMIVSLKHGQWLSFIDMPVGTNIAVEESAYSSYIPKYTLTLDGKSNDPITGEKNTPLGFGKDTHTYIGEGANSAAYINFYDLAPPTGIIVDNVPYIVLIAVGLIAFIGLGIFKNRKEQNIIEE